MHLRIYIHMLTRFAKTRDACAVISYGLVAVCGSVCDCVCVCVRIHTYLYTYTHPRARCCQHATPVHFAEKDHIHIHAYIYTYANIHIYTHTYIHMYAYAHAQTCLRMENKYIHLHTHIRIFIHTYVHKYAYTHTNIPTIGKHSSCVCCRCVAVCVAVCVTYLYTHAYTHTQTYLRMENKAPRRREHAEQVCEYCRQNTPRRKACGFRVYDVFCMSL